MIQVFLLVKIGQIYFIKINHSFLIIQPTFKAFKSQIPVDFKDTIREWGSKDWSNQNLSLPLQHVIVILQN